MRPSAQKNPLKMVVEGAGDIKSGPPVDQERLPGLAVAIPAKYRFIPAGLKRDLCSGVALSAGDGIHLAGRSISSAAVIAGTLGFSSRTTGRTPFGLVGKAFSGEELLFSRGKWERFSAIGTKKGFF
jgi:hypothetical protein